jgi:hypothetical protein
VTTKSINFRGKRPQVLGLGLIALDVVLSEAVPPRYFAGGTCGNVLAILAFLGWNSVGVARIGNDRAAQVVRTDLERWGVDLSLLGLSPTAKTPIIIQRIRKDRLGIPYHTFSWHCPGCGNHLPSFQPVPAKSIEPVKPQLKNTNVLFVDRASPSSVALARLAIEQDMIVFFEPASISEDGNFRAMLDCASIIKYSHDRIDEIETSGPRLLLEVQTMGRGGLRFRSRLGDFGRRWHHLDAHKVSTLVDSAGAGDWMSAGLICSACVGGYRRLSDVSRTGLLNALSLGQALASWNCGFSGARGGMYTEKLREIRDLVDRHKSPNTLQTSQYLSRPDPWDYSYVCESCKHSAQARRGDRDAQSASAG